MPLDYLFPHPRPDGTHTVADSRKFFIDLQALSKPFATLIDPRRVTFV